MRSQVLHVPNPVNIITVNALFGRTRTWSTWLLSHSQRLITLTVLEYKWSCVYVYLHKRLINCDLCRHMKAHKHNEGTCSFVWRFTNSGKTSYKLLIKAQPITSTRSLTQSELTEMYASWCTPWLECPAAETCKSKESHRKTACLFYSVVRWLSWKNKQRPSLEPGHWFLQWSINFIVGAKWKSDSLANNESLTWQRIWSKR